MGDQPKDGGPVHPVGSGDARDGTGMSLRDYFAAHAPITFKDAMVDCYSDLKTASGPDEVRFVTERLAELRWKYADAMLAARGGGS